MRHLRRVLDVSLYPHSNIISVNVKLMSSKYPALPYLTFSEPRLMSENTGPRTHQRTIPHRNEQSEFFSEVPVEIFIYTTVIKTHTHAHTACLCLQRPPRRVCPLLFIPPEKEVRIQPNSPDNCHARRCCRAPGPTLQIKYSSKNKHGPPGKRNSSSLALAAPQT